MNNIKDALTAAMEAKTNDVKSFVWKLARNKETGEQQEIKLIDATEEQLNQFYNHCMSMLYSEDRLNPGRYTLLNIIKEQRDKCNTELFLRKLEKGSICSDGKSYPRYLYLQDLRTFIDMNKNQFPTKELKNISIATITPGIPREFERISIERVITACLDGMGMFDNKHITFSFILNLGVYLTPEEMREFTEKDKDGKIRSRLDVVKERLNMNSSVYLKVKPSGLSFTELRAMIGLKTKKYSELTTDQLVTLRNKVLFKLENEVKEHIEGWEERIRQIKLAVKTRGLTLG